MSRRFVVDGDTTDHGGKVYVPATMNGLSDRNLAVVGDKVHCPKCNVEATIVEGSVSCNAAGFAIAEEGGLTSCGARLIRVTHDSIRFDNEFGRVANNFSVERDWL